MKTLLFKYNLLLTTYYLSMKLNLMDETMMELDSDHEKNKQTGLQWKPSNFLDQDYDEDNDIKAILKLNPYHRTVAHIQTLKNHVKDLKVFKDL